MGFIERELKRKDDGHMVDDAAIAFDPTLAPCPHLRTDVEKHLDPQRLCRLGRVGLGGAIGDCIACLRDDGADVGLRPRLGWAASGPSCGMGVDKLTLGGDE